ncbi:hypothetical protein Lal_00011343 [Lupinus albus]|nr:hypothetical protein Lal_00011343 [Lupinus albus]
MNFFLTMRKVAHVLKTDVLVVLEKTEKEEMDKLAIDIARWNESDYLCKNFILNGLSDDLYDYYSPSHKLVCYALEKKYETEEVKTKKYVVSRYLKHISFMTLTKKVIIEPNDVDFIEKKFSFKLRNSGGTSANHIHVIRDLDKHDELEIESRRSKRTMTVRTYEPDYMVYTLEEV